MNRIDKFLAKIPKTDREKIFHALSCIMSGNLKNLDIKKLKGISNRYRVRIGVHRIQFEVEKENIFIVDIGRKDDNTYKF